MSISQNIVTSSLPVQQAVARHIWPERLQWKHVIESKKVQRELFKGFIRALEKQGTLVEEIQ